jgi:hypothetical protein
MNMYEHYFLLKPTAEFLAEYNKLPLVEKPVTSILDTILTPEARDRLADRGINLPEIRKKIRPTSASTKPRFWCLKNVEGCDNWQEDDWLTFGKMMQITDFARSAKNLKDDEYFSYLFTWLPELFGEPPYDVSVFDRWWTIESFTHGKHMQEVVILSKDAAFELLGDEWDWFMSIEARREFSEDYLIDKMWPVVQNALQTSSTGDGSAYAMLRPTSKLLDFLSQYPYDKWLPNQVWEGVIANDDASLLILKKLFIINQFDCVIRAEEKGEKPILREIVTELFGDPPYDEKDFDPWWTIEIMERYTHFDTYTKMNSPGLLRSLTKTGNPRADKWIDDTIVRLEQEG